MASKGKEVHIRKYTLEKVQDTLVMICYIFHNLDQVSVCSVFTVISEKKHSYL